MRKELSKALLTAGAAEEKMVFLTGDLGYMAFEELQSLLGKRFVNMGVSEQNMISVAASLAYDGFIPFTYSIAPFVVNRPFEQIRNEIGLHNMPVKIIANGGGYGYGIMGSTHHCLEDLALMRSVQNMVVYAPTFNDDVAEVVELMMGDGAPNYLRLNNSVARPAGTAPFQPFRRLHKGQSGVVIGIGPVVLNITAAMAQELDLDVWVIGRLPCGELPAELVKNIKNSQRVLSIEEHYQGGGIGEMLASIFLRSGHSSGDNFRFESLFSRGYPSGNYGDQKWHQEENALAGAPLTAFLNGFFDGPGKN